MSAMLYAAVAVALTAGLAFGAQANDEKTPPPAPTTESDDVIYVPPDRGAPVTRVAGASRGDDASIRVEALAPPQAGLAAKAQPTLYWRLSGVASADARFALTITNEDSFETIIETELPGVFSPGAHALRLSELGVTLEPGVPYQWHVAIVSDAAQRSLDLVASAGVIHQPLTAAVAGGDAETKSAAYARLGYWYDAIDAVMSAPKTAQMAAIEASLLDQAGVN